MKKFLLLVACAAVWSNAAFAATKTVTLDVPGMYCSVCPITVKKALEKVPRVSKAATSLERKEAVVTYDDAKTNIDALLDATFTAAYPSEVKAAKGK